MRSWRRRGCRVVAALALALVGCTADGEPAGLNPTGPTERSSTPAISGLPPCESEPPAAEDTEVPGLVVPDGAVVTTVTPQDPLTRVDGYVAMTPVEVRAYYQQLDDLQIILIEDEVYEAEVLLSDGEYRSYVKALAQCAQASRFLVVVAPEGEGVTLPAPAQGGN